MCVKLRHLMTNRMPLMNGEGQGSGRSGRGKGIMVLVSSALHGSSREAWARTGCHGRWAKGRGGGGGGGTDMQPTASSHACMHTKRNGYISLDGHIKIRDGLSYLASSPYDGPWNTCAIALSCPKVCCLSPYEWDVDGLRVPRFQGRTPDLTTTWRENGFVPKPNLPVYFHIWKYRRTPGMLDNKAILGNLSTNVHDSTIDFIAH